MFSKRNSNTKKKVVIVLNDFLVGGIQKLAIDQMRGLKDEYEFVLVVLMQFQKDGFYHLVPSKIPVYKLHFKSFHDIRSLIELFKILRKENPDIVKSAMFFSNTLVRILKPFFKFRVISAEHNTESKRPFLHKCINFLLSKITYTIVADSNTVADHVSKSEWIPRNKFSVIYNGVELAEIERAEQEFLPLRDSIRIENKIDSNTPVFLTVARLVLQKNHRLMIEGFASFLGKGNKGKLLIIGDGVLIDRLKEQVLSLNLAEHVVFLGERQDIYKFYVASDYFLLTSVREGFCISAMNGLAFGLPLISTRVAGVVEYLKDGENGYFIDDTTESLSSVLHEIVHLDHESLSILKSNAKKTARDFGVDAHVNKYRELFSNCLK